MQTSVTFINLDSSEALKAYACEKLDRFDKYIENCAKANIVLTVEKFRNVGGRMRIISFTKEGKMQ
ncbi:MAG: HPF/RaiA family ribosome-associated protein [Deltaproteobacteria bacterium]|nr:HPF/RaiA family ribosome-associated protein [Deltaproteobacteria bacterium]MBW1795418.1 HPF/RaiA family ribosome-associated protein [Deltaproteobacteria bacterium]